MDRAEIKKVLSIVTKEIDEISDPKVVAIQKTLLNLIEILVAENEQLRNTVQSLKNEINRLKGEQGKPTIRKQKKDDDDFDNGSNHSSEKNREKLQGSALRKPKNKKKGNLRVDRSVTCEFDKTNLPDDAVFKGYDSVVIQDIKIITDNVEFKREVYYSASLNKTFMAELPAGYYGEFGPGIHALTLTLYNDSGMTEPALNRFFKTFGIEISKATISRIITDKHEAFHQEKEDIIDAGLKATNYQHFDDTSARVNGKNHHTHILCNPYYTAYFTTPKKDRLTVLEILCRDELKFLINQESYLLMLDLGLSEKRLSMLKELCADGVMTRKEIDVILKQLFPNPKKQSTNRRIILEAGAIVYYKGLDHAIEHLICDDAPQFNKIAKHKVLCWIHEGRHYKKLNPIINFNRKILDEFIENFWKFYKKLLDYKSEPTFDTAIQLSKEFEYPLHIPG
jgi:hypothetical protein